MRTSVIFTMEDIRIFSSEFLEHHGARLLWREIRRLTMEKVFSELVKKECSVANSRLILRKCVFPLNIKIRLDNVVFVPWLIKYDPSDSPFILFLEVTCTFRDENSVNSEPTITDERRGSVNDSVIVRG